MCGPARADVFVPADPPPLSGVRCAAGAGDVLAAAVGDSEVRISLAGGPWTAVGGLTACPTVAAAADGSAALSGTDVATGDAVLRVRAAGGEFGPPIALGTTNGEPTVAVAPGGWAAAAWIADGRALLALVVRPDGTTTRAELDRGERVVDDDPTFLMTPQVGIDANGDTTVVWQRWARAKVRVRIARGTAGGAPATGPDLSVNDAESTNTAGPSVSVAPSGTEVVAWSTPDGVAVSVDGQASQHFPGGEARVATAVADGGPIVLAYTTSANEIVTVERVGGTWSSPRVIATVPLRDVPDYGEQSDVSIVGAAVAPDGLATALWQRIDNTMTARLYGALGRVGGAWGGPQALSSVTRSSTAAGLWLDPTGASRVVWTEGPLGLRGASVADRPADSTPPIVSVRFPSSVSANRVGRFTARVRVRCSEACDARLAFPGAVDEYNSVVRSLAAGRTQEFRLGPSAELVEKLLREPKSRRVHLQLVVTDRAGNIVRRTGVLRVRVIEKPIRALKVAPNHDFGMKTAEGNRLVVKLVNDVIDAAAARRVTQRALNRRFDRGRTAIRRAGHREITSGRVYTKLYEALALPLSRAGYDIEELFR
ncbi:hypothetical protein [Solirubrobacter soli]|uniref:hypothetical protein n=1 Tax=Solirubrobacter soli TaxID=363832 RepID=UPI0012F91DD5|nr:hypothetical protein [Solirubrobacter soli]